MNHNADLDVPLKSSGFALPFVLAHTGVIADMAGWMSAAGGAVGYATSQSIVFSLSLSSFDFRNPAFRCDGRRL